MTKLQTAATEALEVLRMAASCGYSISPKAAENAAQMLVAALNGCPTEHATNSAALEAAHDAIQD